MFISNIFVVRIRFACAMKTTSQRGGDSGNPRSRTRRGYTGRNKKLSDAADCCCVVMVSVFKNKNSRRRRQQQQPVKSTSRFSSPLLRRAKRARARARDTKRALGSRQTDQGRRTRAENFFHFGRAGEAGE